MIKRIAALLTGFLWLSISTFAQPVFTIESGSADPGSSYSVDITVDDFTDILSAQFSINWDPAVLTYNSVTNFNLPDLGAGNIGTPADPDVDPGQMTMLWFDNSLNGVDRPDGAVLFTVVFDVVGQECDETDIVFSSDPVEIEIADSGENSIGMTPVAGTFDIPGDNCGMGGDEFTVTASMETGSNGDNVCVQFTADNFDDIASIQFTFNFNPAIIQYTGVQNFGIPGMSAGNFGDLEANLGRISVVWIDQTTEGVTLPDGTVLFEVCFDIIGSGGQSTNITYSEDIIEIEVSNGDGQTLEFNGVNGRVNVTGAIDGFTFISSSGTLNLGDEICIDISVNDFEEIISMQFSINWDPNLLEFVSVGSFNLTDLTQGSFGDPEDPDVDEGEMTLVWIHNPLTGVTLPDGTVIFQLCLRAIACDQSTTITFTDEPLEVEVSDVDGVIPVNFSEGTVMVDCDTECGFTIQETNPTCSGDMNGMISLTQVGNCENPITYSWSNGATTAQISNLAADCYSVTVMVGAPPEIHILGPFCLEAPDPIEATATITNVVNGGDGAIDLMVMGGFGSLTYTWNTTPPQTTQDISNLDAGTYTVTIMDDNGCMLVAGPFTVGGGGIIGQVTNVDCFGASTGSIDLTVGSCGTPPYTFAWTGGAMTEDLTNVPAGSYTVTVTDSGGSTCTAQFQVTQANSILVVEADVTHINVGNDGAIDLTVSGGQSPYTYQWSDIGNGPQDRNNLDEGPYSVTVTDAFGCQQVLDLFVIGDGLAVTITPSSYSGFGVSCNGECDGTLSATPINAIGNVTYSWSTGNQTMVVSDVCPGLHSVTVTDESGQTASANVTLLEPQPIQVNVDVDCASEPGVSDGRATASVSGGVPPYNFLWNDAQGTTTSTIQNQPSGQLILFVEDDNGCEFMQPVEICINGIECYEAISVITPNGDGKNDRFVIQCIYDYPTRLSVYETWTGKLEFQMDNYNNSWEGVDASGDVLPDGGYHWVLEVFLPNNDRRVYTGTVTILRKLY